MVSRVSRVSIGLVELGLELGLVLGLELGLVSVVPKYTRCTERCF